MDIEPQTLRTAADGVRTAADDLQQQWVALTSSAQGMGDIFGDDMVGGLIGAGYQAAQQIADDSFRSALEGFSQIAGGLDAMATMYEKTEQSNVSSISANLV